jgi:Zn-dependent M28 family amino/carboxypeptidase
MAVLPLVLASAALSPLAGCGSAPAAGDAIAQADAAIDADAILAHVRYLASDALEGRAPGTRGDELARAYIQQQFDECGLRPAGDGGSWMQEVPFAGITTTVERTLELHSERENFALQAPDDFTAVAGNPEPAAEWRDAEVVFVGYGIEAPEQHWDDFKDVDVTGKVLLVMNNDPEQDPDLFAGRTRLYYGRWSYKYEEAARRGAAGVIIIHTEHSAGYGFHVVQANHGRENFWLPFRPGLPTLPIRSWCTEDAARRICAAGGRDLDALRAAAEKREFAPVPLRVSASLAVRNRVREVRSANVLGVLPGSDPAHAGEFAIVTAHFDHLGRGRPLRGDDIYNGAVDNASGVAGMLVLARACCALRNGLPRSVLFAAVTGEESGLLGSEWLAGHLPCARKDAVADFNIDGLNVWGMTRDVEFIGYGKSSLTQLAIRVAQQQGRRVEPDSEPDRGYFYRSDHFNFARQGIPAMYLKAGNDFVDRPDDRRRMKASYILTHYHQPNDELAPWWNLGGAVADLQLLLRCLVATAEGPPPTWTPGDEFALLR